MQNSSNSSATVNGSKRSATGVLATDNPPIPALKKKVPTRANGGSRSRRERSYRVKPIHRLIVDVLALVAAATVYSLILSMSALSEESLSWPAVFSVLALLLLAGRGFYVSVSRLRPRLPSELIGIIGATAVASATVISLRMFMGESASMATQTVLFWAIAAVCLIAGRAGLWGTRTWARARRSEATERATLIVGAGKIGHRAAKRLLEDRSIDLRPIGFLDGDPLDLDGHSSGLPVLGASWDLEQVILEHGVEHVVVAYSTDPHDVLLSLVRRCWKLGLSVSLVPRLYEVEGERIAVEHIGALPLVDVRVADPKSWPFKVKYALDRVIAALCLLVTLPLLITLMSATWLSMGSPIFFRQRRVGLNGCDFDMLKFRTMNLDDRGDEADEFNLLPDTAPGGIEGTDRRTRVGAFLRRTSLDELPQLINVLRGKMSIVGPRPERPEFAKQFISDVYRYGERHCVKSGITGWAQVHGLRGQTSISDRAEWDNYYIDNWSLLLDFKIMLMTLPCLIRGHSE